MEPEFFFFLLEIYGSHRISERVRAAKRTVEMSSKLSFGQFHKRNKSVPDFHSRLQL